jgi:hypothetical protein
MSELGRQQKQHQSYESPPPPDTTLVLVDGLEKVAPQKEEKKIKSHNKKCEHDRFMQNSCDRCGREDARVIAKRRKDEKMDELKRINDERVEKLKRYIVHLESELTDKEQTIQHLERELKETKDEVEEMASVEQANQRAYGETIEKARQYEDMLKKIRPELMKLETENEYLRHQLKTRQNEGFDESSRGKEQTMEDDRLSKKEEGEESDSDAGSPSSNDADYLCVECKKKRYGGIRWPRQEEIDRRRQIKMYDDDDEMNTNKKEEDSQI